MGSVIEAPITVAGQVVNRTLRFATTVHVRWKPTHV